MIASTDTIVTTVFFHKEKNASLISQSSGGNDHWYSVPLEDVVKWPVHYYPSLYNLTAEKKGWNICSEVVSGVISQSPANNILL